MEEQILNFNLQLAHAFGSTCSLKYQDAIAICDEDTEIPKILFPAGKTIARKYIERQEMDFIKFQNNAQAIQCIHILPTHTHVATSQKLIGSNLRVVRIYNMKGNQKPQTLKIFNDRDGYGVIKSIVFSFSQPQFMCCLIGDPHNKLIYIDVSKNKPLAQSNFTVKDIDKITISPKNSHLICASGGSSVRIFKVQQYAFKPYDDIRRLPKGRRFLTHSWYKGKIVLVVTDQCQVLVIQQTRPGAYQVKQQYSNVFNQVGLTQQKITITAICPFSKGFILGSSTGKFCLWIKKQQGVNYQQQKLELVRRWATTQQRSASVTGIAINSKQDLLAISFANNDITTIFLNELMPQITEKVEQKQKKDIFFEYLYKGFHNNPVTGMDVCLQRPLLATCSKEDSTIRLWNYKNYGCKLLRMFYFRIKDNSIASGNGARDGDGNNLLLHFHFILVDIIQQFDAQISLGFSMFQLRPYRQIAIKGAHIVKFSHGGHMIATASPVRDQSSQQIIHVYNSITLQQIKSFSVHTKKIRTLQWRNYDQYLCSISQGGMLMQWRISDWKQTKKITKHEYKYQCSKYFHNENSIFIFASAFSKYFIHKYTYEQCVPSNNNNSLISSNHNLHTSAPKFQQIQIDMHIVSMSQIKINKRSCLVAGLQNGSIVTLAYNGTNKKILPSSIRSDHIKSVSSLIMSPCNKYLISTGSDCMTFIYETNLIVNGVKQEEDNGNMAVDDFLAEVVLYPKKQIMKYEQKQKQYTKIINSLQRKLQSISQQSDKRHKQKIQQLEVQKNRVIQDFHYRIDRIKQQIDTIKNKNLQALSDLDSKNYAEAAEIQKRYEEKLDFEKQKYFQLQQQVIQQKLLQKNRLKQLENEKQSKIQQIKLQFKQKFKQSQKIYSKSKQIVNETTQLFEQKIKHIQQQQEQELRQLLERLQHFKTEKALVQQQLQQKQSKVKKDHQMQRQQCERRKIAYQGLMFNKKKIDKEVQEARQKLKQMKTEYEQKIQILNNKQVKIVQFEKKLNDLQKKKHILGYKATQMKKALQPKQVQIQKLKLDLIKLKKQFQTSLQRKQKFVLYMQKIQKQRQLLQRQVRQNQNQVSKCSNHLDQIIYDIYTSIQNNKDDPDSKAYSRSILKLYHKYVEKISEKQDSHNQKGVQEMTKQIVHLEKSLFQMNQSNKKNVVRKHDEIGKRVGENAQLINNLNDLKKQKQQLIRSIKSKNNEIQSLKTQRNQALIQSKKEDHSFIPYQQQQLSSSNFNVIEKKKPTLLDMNPREKTTSTLNQYKKKQCELVSQNQFINQRIHKIDFYMKQIRDSIKKHFTLYKCAGERFSMDNDMSAIM